MSMSVASRGDQTHFASTSRSTDGAAATISNGGVANREELMSRVRTYDRSQLEQLRSKVSELETTVRSAGITEQPAAPFISVARSVLNQRPTQQSDFIARDLLGQVEFDPGATVGGVLSTVRKFLDSAISTAGKGPKVTEAQKGNSYGSSVAQRHANAATSFNSTDSTEVSTRKVQPSNASTMRRPEPQQSPTAGTIVGPHVMSQGGQGRVGTDPDWMALVDRYLTRLGTDRPTRTWNAGSEGSSVSKQPIARPSDTIASSPPSYADLQSALQSNPKGSSPRARSSIKFDEYEKTMGGSGTVIKGKSMTLTGVSRNQVASLTADFLGPMGPGTTGGQQIGSSPRARSSIKFDEYKKTLSCGTVIEGKSMNLTNVSGDQVKDLTAAFLRSVGPGTTGGQQISRLAEATADMPQSNMSQMGPFDASSYNPSLMGQSSIQSGLGSRNIFEQSMRPALPSAISTRG